MQRSRTKPVTKTAPAGRPALRKRDVSPSPGRHAHYAPRLIGYAILAVAALLVAIGVATA